MFKDIAGFEGLYQVSDAGVVRSLERVVLNKRGKPQKYPAKTLQFDLTSVGRHRVVLSKDHKRYQLSLHRVVAEAFIPNPHNKPDINHIDNNPLNNCVENLEWCTHSENMLHAQKQGRLFANQSKAGKTAGKIASAKVVDNAVAMLSKVYGCWEVLSPADRRGRKYYFHTRCIHCHSEATRELHYLKHNPPSHCTKCANKIEI